MESVEQKGDISNMSDRLYKESDIIKRFNYLYGSEYSVSELFYKLDPISRNPEVTPEDLTAFLMGEWVNSDTVQAVLCMDFSECIRCKQLEFSRTAEWSKTGNGQDITTEFRIKPKDNWIKCSEQMPPEHNSMFAHLKGTDKWKRGMFEKRSDDVNVTYMFEDGSRKTGTYHTIDGVWNFETSPIKRRAIAWQPLPETYNGGE